MYGNYVVKYATLDTNHKTKHIDIRYHFLRDHYEKGDTDIDYVSTDF